MSHPRLTVLSGHGDGAPPCSTRLVSCATSAAAAHTAKLQPPQSSTSLTARNPSATERDRRTEPSTGGAGASRSASESGSSPRSVHLRLERQPNRRALRSVTGRSPDGVRRSASFRAITLVAPRVNRAIDVYRRNIAGREGLPSGFIQHRIQAMPFGSVRGLFVRVNRSRLAHPTNSLRIELSV